MSHPYSDSKNRRIWLPVAGTWLAVLVILILILLAGTKDANGIEDSDSGGNTAALVLLGIATLPFFVGQIRIRFSRWVPWLIGGLSSVLGLTLAVSSLVGPSIVSWAIYGGLQVGKAGQPFNDLAWIFRWAECDGCVEEFPGYSLGVLWIKPLTFGQISEVWAIPIGFILIFALSACLIWLAKSSEAGALPFYLLISVGSAWLIFLDRANADSLVFLAIIATVFAYQRHPRLWVWAGIAAGIWWLGTWKYYPFALGVLLAPALMVKRGWLVVSGFGLAVFLYIFTQSGSRVEGFDGSQLGEYLDGGNAFGRIPIIFRMSPDSDLGAFLTLPNLIVFGMAGLAFLWGWTFSTVTRTNDIPKAMLAIGGSGMFLANILFSGFGFSYKGAFLILMIPLIAVGFRMGGSFGLYTAISCLILIAVSNMLSYSILLTSLASILAASLAAGAAIPIALRALRKPKAPKITRGNKCYLEDHDTAIS